MVLQLSPVYWLNVYGKASGRRWVEVIHHPTSALQFCKRRCSKYISITQAGQEDAGAQWGQREEEGHSLPREMSSQGGITKSEKYAVKDRTF